MKATTFILAWAFCLSAAPASAQEPYPETLPGESGGEAEVVLPDDGIITDRPDQAESPQTVGKLRFQVETSVDIETDEAGGVRTTMWSTPTKLRFGVLDGLELHLQMDGFVSSTVHGSGGTTTYGFSDLGFGFKAQLIEGGQHDGAAPHVGLLANVTAPSGTRQMTGGDWVPSAIMAAGWDLPQSFGLGANIGIAVPRDDDGTWYSEGFWAVALSRTWAPLTDRVGTFVELYGDIPYSTRASATMLFDGGFVFLVMPSIQIDIAVRAGILGPVPDVGGGIGASFKI